MHLASPLIAVLALSLAACSKTSTQPTGKGDSVEEAPAREPHAPSPVTYELSQEQQALIFESPIHTLEGEATTLGVYRGQELLLVNVASQCGFTPQYEQLQALQARYQDRGFTVIGFPSNQFGEQEPGTPEEIRAFGKDEYKVSFPLMEKIAANGEDRHPVYRGLTQIKDARGESGDVKWNFEKFLISADGKRVTRFRTKMVPDDPQVIKVLEAGLQ